MGVSKKGKEIGAGDQGLMFGYACQQTKELMPLPIMLAHKLAKKLAEVRKKKVLPYLGPDGKTQVTVEYRDGKPVRVDYVVIAASHTAAVVTRNGKFTTDEAKREIIAKVVHPVVGNLLDKKTKITVNGTGKFLVSGPQADTGLTGRKIIVDTYGGWAVHGGGAFSGKDPTKVDRSGGYMARYVAKNLVAAGLAKECLVQIAYCIGLVDPVSVMVNSYGTGTLPDEVLSKLVRKVFPLSPRGIIDHLKLRQPVYRQTAAYGHFGRKEFAWERVDATEELLAKAKKI
jgi:S-adenosylmethionine synthetase